MDSRAFLSLHLIDKQRNLAEAFSKKGHVSRPAFSTTLGVVVVHYGALFYIAISSCGCFSLVEKNLVLESILVSGRGILGICN